MTRLHQLSACLGAFALLGGLAGLGSSIREAAGGVMGGMPARVRAWVAPKAEARPVAKPKVKAKAKVAAVRRNGRFKALDLSRPFGSQRHHFRADRWAGFLGAERRRGLQMVVVQARGSRTNNPYADLMLQGAREQGLATAAYVFIAFDRKDQPGDVQVQRALQSIGSEKKHLSFFCIDVESAAAGTVSPAERVNRIGQAVHATTAAGLRPVIYAKNTGGRNGEWTDLTGGTDDFRHLPLWVPRYDNLPHLRWDLVEGQPWEPFGGWTQRAGKQYNDGVVWGNPYEFPADENVFDWSLAAGPVKPKPYEVTPLLKVTQARPTRNPQTGHWEQRVRVTNRSGSSVYAPVSLVLRGLKRGVDLVNKSGIARSAGPSGAPYVKVAKKQLPPGASVVKTLRFESPSARPIDFMPVALAGHGDI